MVTEAVVIIDEEHAMLVGLPVVSDFLAHDVRPFKLSIPAGWFDCTHLWFDQVYNLTLYVYNDAIDMGVGINEPAMQLLKRICSAPQQAD